MADNTIDVMMRVVGPKNDIAADSFSILAKDDDLQKDFRPGYFCDLIEFSFSAGAEGAMSNRSKEQEKLRTMQANLANLSAKKEQPPAPRWQKSNDLLVLDHVQKQRRQAEKKRTISSFMDMQPVEFTRIMDSASTLLFKALVQSETIKQVTIIKRKAAGVEQAGLCYLRLDFSQVLFTHIDWKDEQSVVHESATFIYRGLQVRYRPQLPSGTLGATVSMDWKMTTPT